MRRAPRPGKACGNGTRFARCTRNGGRRLARPPGGLWPRIERLAVQGPRRRGGALCKTVPRQAHVDGVPVRVGLLDRAGRERAQFGGPRVSPLALAQQVKQSNGPIRWCCRSAGRSWPTSPGTPAAAKADRVGQARLPPPAAEGRALRAVQHAACGPRAPGFVYGQSFKTRFGRRVLMSGLDAKLISGFLAGRSSRSRTSRAAVRTCSMRTGVVVASPFEVRRGRAPSSASRDCCRRIAKGERRARSAATSTSPPTRAGHALARCDHRPEGQPLRLGERRPHRFVPWILLAGFGIAAAMALVLLRRSLSSAAALADATRSSAWPTSRWSAAPVSCRDRTSSSSDSPRSPRTTCRSRCGRCGRSPSGSSARSGSNVIGHRARLPRRG